MRELSGAETFTLAHFPDPLAPATAATPGGDGADDARDRSPSSCNDLPHERVIIEGAGGLLVRFDDDGGTIADVAELLQAPLIVVARAGLGTLNHTALTVEAIHRRGLTCLGIVIGSWPQRPRLGGRMQPRGPREHRACPRTHPGRTIHAHGDPRMILDIAREQVLERGIGLDEAQVLEVLRLPDELVDDALELAHEVRMRHCGPEVEVEGIVSIKTGGCPEDCHFCSQSGQFETPVRAVRLDIPSLVEAARETAATGATEFCIVAAVRGPDKRLMEQVREGVKAIQENVDINVACSLGILTREQGEELRDLGVHRYNHNLETARSHFPSVVTTHTWEERWETLQLVREMGMEVCCGGIIGMGESLEQRAELAAQFAALDPDEVPLNFLDPRPGTPFADYPHVEANDALRTIAAFRLAMPRTILRFAGGRELTLGDLGARQGMVGGINAVIVGNYLTTLGRDPQEDLDLLAELSMPVKELSKTL